MTWNQFKQIVETELEKQYPGTEPLTNMHINRIDICLVSSNDSGTGEINVGHTMFNQIVIEDVLPKWGNQ